jgi:D-beta-D-heptose 7-phosphate kinase/D-beta-D-heptose 1-phosphate adenosyltransferase
MSIRVTRERVVSLLSAAAGKRIVVVGDAMLDVYLSGDVERISPEAPVPVVRVGHQRHALGGAANVAQNVVAIGAECDLVTAVGSDAEGAIMRSLLERMIVNLDSLLTVARFTTCKTRIVARSQQLLRFDREDDATFDGAEEEALLTRVRDAVANADALILEDYNKGALSVRVIHFAIASARARNIPIVVDPKHRHFFEFQGATIFKPNRRELQAAMGEWVDLNAVDALPQVVARVGAEYLLMTLGEEGMSLIGRDGSAGRVPTAAREVYDVVGAGDTVTAYLAVMLAAGATAGEAAFVANIAAGIEVGKLGAASVSPGELVAFLDEHFAPP